MKNVKEKLVGKFFPKKRFKKKSNQNFERERISDLLNRLKRFNSLSNSFKLDFLSIPHALQMVLKLFPSKYCRDIQLKEKSLRAFVTTIIPGSEENEEFLIKMYGDEYYQFHTYCGYFVLDLNRRSKKLFNKNEFYLLNFIERTKVIQNALEGRELTRRLYKGAILMAQVSYYGAVYNEEKGCQLIEFPGRNNGYAIEKTTYPFAGNYFNNELSLDGHPW